MLLAALPACAQQPGAGPETGWISGGIFCDDPKASSLAASVSTGGPITDVAVVTPDVELTTTWQLAQDEIGEWSGTLSLEPYNIDCSTAWGDWYWAAIGTFEDGKTVETRLAAATR